MDFFYDFGFHAIHHLQESYKDYEDAMVLISAFVDVRNSFSFLFPICFHLQNEVGIKLIWATVLEEWINIVMKWILFGQRPYWWIYETKFYHDSLVPKIRQFPSTCEATPGSPSGHAMQTASAYYIIVTAILANLFQSKLCSFHKQFLQIGMWLAFWTIEISVCVSRCFLATHFPHQVFTGAITGILLARKIYYANWLCEANFKLYFYTTVFLISFATGFYLVLKIIEVDLLWSEEMAKKWCAHPEWLNINNTSFASLFRVVGALFGLGLILNSPLYKKYKKAHIRFRICSLATSMIFVQLFDLLKPSSQDILLFYILSFCKYATIPVLVVGISPLCVFHMLRL